MTQKNLSTLINQLTQSSRNNQPMLITHQNKRVSVILPVKDQQTFQAQQNEKVRQMKVEFDHILTFVRHRLQKSRQAQAQLVQLQQQIKQDPTNLDPSR